MLHYLYDNASTAFNPLTIQTLAVALGLAVLGIYGLVREKWSPVSVRSLCRPSTQRLTG